MQELVPCGKHGGVRIQFNMMETYEEKENNHMYLVTDAVLCGYRENYTKGCLVRPAQEHSKVFVLLF